MFCGMSCKIPKRLATVSWSLEFGSVQTCVKIIDLENAEQSTMSHLVWRSEGRGMVLRYIRADHPLVHKYRSGFGSRASSLRLRERSVNLEYSAKRFSCCRSSFARVSHVLFNIKYTYFWNMLFEIEYVIRSRAYRK